MSFKTVGCRLNQAETAVIRASFEEAGYSTVSFGMPCDICVIHGCVVTAKAEEDSLRLARSIKNHYPDAFVILAGCAAEFLFRHKVITPFCHSRANGNPEEDLCLDSRLRGNDKPSSTRAKQCNVEIPMREYPDADYLAGQKEKFNLPEILGMRFQTVEKQQTAPVPLFSTKRAIVKIQDGCDSQCAYCIVPRVRGASRSRSAAEIIEEISKLTLCGFPEIVLTGANIGCYADGDCCLPQLLEKAEAISGLKRFRISSLEISNAEQKHNTQQCQASSEKRLIKERLSFPIKSGIQKQRLWISTFVGMTDTVREIIDFMASSKKMCRYLHLPLQSGSDRILKAMGRPYTAEKFSAVVQYAQKKLGQLGLGTDIIAGFPGETEDDFLATEQIVRQLPFTKLHVFNYSPRPGTPAFSIPAQVSDRDKKMRSARLIELGRQKRNEFARSLVGKQVSFLVEKITPDGWAEGWTGEYIRARIQGTGFKPKQIVEFVPASAGDDVLFGTLESDPDN